jgi:hypothetical protein
MDKPIPMHNRVTLLTLCRGAAVEVFQRSWDAVLANVEDLNTPWRKAREIVLKVKITPSGEDRDEALTEITCVEKLAGVKPAATAVHIGRIQNELVAMESNLRQAEMFDATPAQAAAKSEAE